MPVFVLDLPEVESETTCEVAPFETLLDGLLLEVEDEGEAVPPRGGPDSTVEAPRLSVVEEERDILCALFVAVD